MAAAAIAANEFVIIIAINFKINFPLSVNSLGNNSCAHSFIHNIKAQEQSFVDCPIDYS